MSFFLIDSIPDLIPQGKRWSPEITKRLVAGLKKISDEFYARGGEIFICESPDNHYRPAPPNGWTALRSHKRRLFLVSWDDLADLSKERIEQLVATGRAITIPL